MNIGEKITHIRKVKNLSQKEVVLSVNIDRAQYSRIENGKANPTLSTLEKIANALEVNIGEFFKEDKNYDVNSCDSSLVEKIKLIEQLDDEQKKSLFTFIDTAVSNKRLRDTLSNALNVAS